jgi:hypothetical protein
MQVGLIGLLLGDGWQARGQTPNAKEAQAREMEILRKTLAEQQKNPSEIIRTPQTLAFSTNAAVSASRAALERQYLDGKITAKQFQKSLEQLQEQERRQAVLAARNTKAEPTVPKAAAASVPATNATTKSSASQPAALARPVPPKTTAAGAGTAAAAAGTATNAPGAAAAEVTPEQKKLTEVETRLEEMLRLKAERDKAATNAVGNANTKVPAAPLTKRQRLDALLRQYVDGKLSDSEYNTQRNKIVAEPD